MQAPRGVYRMREKVMGRWVYYAWSSRGEVLEMCRPRRGESDAEVVWALAALLRIEDRKHLTLVRPAAARRLASPSPISERRRA